MHVLRIVFTSDEPHLSKLWRRTRAASPQETDVGGCPQLNKLARNVRTRTLAVVRPNKTQIGLTVIHSCSPITETYSSVFSFLAKGPICRSRCAPTANAAALLHHRTAASSSAQLSAHTAIAAPRSSLTPARVAMTNWRDDRVFAPTLRPPLRSANASTTTADNRP
jgi:hypothetical protein